MNTKTHRLPRCSLQEMHVNDLIIEICVSAGLRASDNQGNVIPPDIFCSAFPIWTAELKIVMIE